MKEGTRAMVISQHEITEKFDEVSGLLCDLRSKLKAKLLNGEYYSSRHSDERRLIEINVILEVIDL